MKKYILFFLLLLIGCNSDFSPNGPFHQQLVVYAVLDGSTPTQIVRVFATSNPNSYDPLKPNVNNEVQNAFLSMGDGDQTFIFHDTTIVLNDGNSSTRNVHAYVNYSLQPVEKKKYTLTVAKPGFDTSRSVISSISFGDILPGNITALTKPATVKSIPIRVLLGTNVRAFLPMIFLEYELQNNGVRLTREIPMEVVKNELGDVIKKNYSKISFRDASSTFVGTYETITFNSDALIATANEIKNENVGVNVKFTGSLLTLVQFDNNLYTYYSVANNFAGSATLRLDEPDFSNIINGFGVFGMQNSQTKTYGPPTGF